MKFPVIKVSFMKANGMALFPFILVRNDQLKESRALVNHETIHIMQQIELLVLPFYILYLLHYLVNLVKYRKHYPAYRNIIFEREAFAKEKDLEYLKNRKLYAWVSFKEKYTGS